MTEYKLSSRLQAFLIHYTPLADRLVFQQSSYVWNLFNPILVDENNHLASLFIDKSLSVLSHRVKLSIMSQISAIYQILNYHSSMIKANNIWIRPASASMARSRPSRESLSVFYRLAVNSLSNKNLTLSSQHLLAISIFAHSGKEFGLFLEDDAMAIPSSVISFETEMKKMLASIDSDKEGYYDISNSFGWKPSCTGQGVGFSKMVDGQTKCSSSYILTQKTAHMLLSRYEYPILPIDWHLSYLLRTKAIPTYWAFNPLFEQASQIGSFRSNQLDRNR